MKLVLSTDVCGVYGDPPDWERAWGEVLEDKNFVGFEVIGWKRLTSLLSSNPLKLPIVGIHGRTGGISDGKNLTSKVILGSLNSFLVDVPKIIFLSDRVNYILIHRTALSNQTRELLLEKSASLQNLYIENDISLGAFTKTSETVASFREQGLMCGMMFDVVHFLREPYLHEPYMKRWDKLLAALESLRKVGFPLSCHFPIGEYVNDSLPVFEMAPSQWSELSSVIAKIPLKYIVLENQSARKYSLYLTRERQLLARARTHKVYELLKLYKIL